MQRWESVLSADTRTDLTIRASVVAWVSERLEENEGIAQSWISMLRNLAGAWREEHDLQWREFVHALRSLAPRLKKRKGRATAMNTDAADDLFRLQIQKLVPFVISPFARTSGGDIRPQQPLSAKTFKCVRLLPSGMSSLTAKPIIRLRSVIDAFWQGVFGSMVTDHFLPVCGWCSRELKLNKKGGQVRTQYCSKVCRNAADYAERKERQKTRRPSK